MSLIVKAACKVCLLIRSHVIINGNNYKKLIIFVSALKIGNLIINKQIDNLKAIENLAIELNTALHNIDESTKTKLENHNLQVGGISLSLQRVQIGIDRTLNDMKDSSKKLRITKAV